MGACYGAGWFRICFLIANWCCVQAASGGGKNLEPSNLWAAQCLLKPFTKWYQPWQPGCMDVCVCGWGSGGGSHTAGLAPSLRLPSTRSFPPQPPPTLPHPYPSALHPPHLLPLPRPGAGRRHLHHPHSWRRLCSHWWVLHLRACCEPRAACCMLRGCVLRAACCVLHAAWLRAASCMLRAACCVLHAAWLRGCVLRAACCELHAASCVLRAACCELRAASCVLRSVHCVAAGCCCVLQ